RSSYDERPADRPPPVMGVAAAVPRTPDRTWPPRPLGGEEVPGPPVGRTPYAPVDPGAVGIPHARSLEHGLAPETLAPRAVPEPDPRDLGHRPLDPTHLGSAHLGHAEPVGRLDPGRLDPGRLDPTRLDPSDSGPGRAERWVTQTPANRLNPKYTFETFVIGSSNRFAHAAAVAVAESPAKAYNPLFIYGSSGLGKTHLLHAIGHYASQLGNARAVRYVSTEEFTNDFINSVRDDKASAFQRRYRDVDVLLIDDIQFLESRERTQEEFFHTFNTLHNANK